MSWGKPHGLDPREAAAEHLARAVRDWLRRPTTGNAERMEQALASYDEARRQPPQVLCRS